MRSFAKTSVAMLFLLLAPTAFAQEEAAEGG